MRTFFLLKIYFAVLLVPALPGKLLSQHYLFSHITTQQGLSSNKVHRVLQDSRGFYWIATANGLNRFDGSSFKIYRHQRDDSNSVADNYCTSLAEDSLGNIWISTYNGLSVYLRRENRFRTFYFTHPDLEEEKLNKITDFTMDTKGNIWMASGGLSLYNTRSGRFTLFRHQDNNPATIADNSAPFGLQYDATRDGVWFSTNAGIQFYNNRSGYFQHRENNPGNSKLFGLVLPGPLSADRSGRLWYWKDESRRFYYFDIAQNREVETALRFSERESVRSLHFDTQNRLWVAFWNSRAIIFNPDKKITDTSFFYVRNRRSALHETFTHLYTDPKGNYWISSYNGISVYQPGKSYYDLHELSFAGRGFDNQQFLIGAIAPARHSLIWLGTNHGLFRYHLLSHQLQKIAIPDLHEKIVTLYLENDSVLWIGKRNSVLRMDCRRDIITGSVALEHPSVIRGDGWGHTWVGTWSSGVYRLNERAQITGHYTDKNSGRQYLPYNGVLSMNQGEQGLLVGLNNSYGFARFDVSADSFKQALLLPEKGPPFTGGTVNAVLPLGADSTWLGTHGRGLYFLPGAQQPARQFTVSEGLSSNFINSILKDQAGRIWVSTSNGIDVFNRHTGRFVTVQDDLVFPYDDYIPSGAYGPDGELFFFCLDKIARVYPEKYGTGTDRGPVLITGLKIFEKEALLPDPGVALRLTHRQNFFSIDYSLLRVNPEEQVQYAYRLKGFDRDWNEVDSRRVAAYTNVPGGKYIFQVKAARTGGDWDDAVTELPVYISLPYWKQGWFILLVSLFIISMLYLLYRYRIGQLRKLMEMRTKISQDLHDDVASTLSGIRLYSELAKQQLEEQRPGQLYQSLDVIASNASSMKAELNDIVWAVNPSNDSLQKLLGKLERYATELTKAAGITFRFSAEASFPEEKLDMQQRRNIYMICKEAINNAVKYSGATLLETSVRGEKGFLQIMVKDNGSGFDRTTIVAGNGLVNMQLRAREIRGTVSIDSRPGEGTCVTLDVRT